MAVTLGILALLEAKPDRSAELSDFLQQGRAIAEQEEGTVTWYAFRIGNTTFGIFDSFESEEARQAHIAGEIPKALAKVGSDLLAAEPDIRPVDVIAVK
jgi:quinol monooxygenase YgiN